MASNEIRILEERIRHLEQQLKLQQVQFGRLAQSVFDNSELRNLKDMNALKKAVAEIDHGSLLGLNDDDHSQYLNTTRHDTTDRHTLGTVVPHIWSS